MGATTQHTETPSFLSVSSCAQKYASAGFSKASLRWLLFNRQHNGFSRCVVRIGRKVLIDEVEFVAWLRSQRETRSAA
jgi:hypothetical protein